jgi:hypothetical protein
MITFRLDLDSEGNPKYAPSISDNKGESIRLDQMKDDNVRFEIRQGRQKQTLEAGADQSAILAHILSDWAEARMDHTFSNIRLNFSVGADLKRINGIAFSSWEYSLDGFRDASDESEADARKLGFIVGQAEAPDAIQFLKTGIAKKRKRK